MTAPASPELLVLHAVRLSGMATTDAVAARYGLEPAPVEGLLLDLQASGQVGEAQFDGTGGWFVTDAGRRADERLLAEELRTAGAEPVVRSVHARFLPLDARLQSACTDRQLRPTADDPLAADDHGDDVWDRAVLDELGALALALGPLARQLSTALASFDGDDRRSSAALRRARAGDPAAVDGSDRDSCHTVWFQLHEDLLATPGLQRGAEHREDG